MLRHLMKSKIHRATITSADLHYEGSLTLDMETPPTLALSNDSPLYAAGPLLLTAHAAGAFSPPSR